MKNNDKWVIGVDLDGTTLMKWNGKVDENGDRIDRVHETTKEAFKLMQEQGHTIVLDTGRNWLEAKKLYEMLGLNSFIINSAGAHIHNPADEKFEDILTGMPNKIVKEIINDEKVKEHLTSWIVDKVNDTHMKVNPNSENFVKNGKFFWKVTEFNGEFDFDPQSSVIYLNLDKEETLKMADYLRDKYGEIIHITYWGTQDEGRMNGIELNPASSNKGTAILKVAEALGVPPENTMGFGDGENDIEMIKQTGVGVVMKNAIHTIKHLADDFTELTNEEGGVGDYLIKYFNLK